MVLKFVIKKKHGYFMNIFFHYFQLDICIRWLLSLTSIELTRVSTLPCLLVCLTNPVKADTFKTFDLKNPLHTNSETSFVYTSRRSIMHVFPLTNISIAILFFFSDNCLWGLLTSTSHLFSGSCNEKETK